MCEADILCDAPIALVTFRGGELSPDTDNVTDDMRGEYEEAFGEVILLESFLNVFFSPKYFAAERLMAAH